MIPSLLLDCVSGLVGWLASAAGEELLCDPAASGLCAVNREWGGQGLVGRRPSTWPVGVGCMPTLMYLSQGWRVLGLGCGLCVHTVATF